MCFWLRLRKLRALPFKRTRMLNFSNSPNYVAEFHEMPNIARSDKQQGLFSLNFFLFLDFRKKIIEQKQY